MKKLFFLFLLSTIGKSIAQQDPCATTTSYSLTYQSTNGSGSCTFLFTPTVTINQMGSSVKLVQYTFTIESTTVQVCYSGNPLAIVNCNGSFSALPEGANQVFPTATVVLPCTGNGTIVLRGSTSTQGASTCTTQTIKSGPLPVKLVSFNGSSTPAGVVLNWATEWESLNEGYEIQKSATAQSFENIGFVQGQGSTHKVSGYEFIDANVEPGTIYYYRLKQKDVGGIIEYSPIISVLYRTDQEMPIKVYPNGNTGGRFMLSMSDAQSATIRLFTEAGIEVPINVSKTTDPNQVSVAAKATLSSGVYFLKVNGISDPQQQVIRVIVQ
ncbi:T9SS type A sorting domain-containing protein [Spirosoma litoris]